MLDERIVIRYYYFNNKPKVSKVYCKLYGKGKRVVRPYITYKKCVLNFDWDRVVPLGNTLDSRVVLRGTTLISREGQKA